MLSHINTGTLFCVCFFKDPDGHLNVVRGIEHSIRLNKTFSRYPVTLYFINFLATTGSKGDSTAPQKNQKRALKLVSHKWNHL